ncbi:MAG: hypothetical protein M3178_14910 [Pseudomonadota bacterium]|nr:hypothetical protein [Pseudomonadota bacterium]
MSYLVFALGTLLSLCGAFAIYAGYGIILVERGWAGVIAGATALSCGIVTIALGCILHSLSGLHALLKTGKGLTPLPGELGEDEASELGPEPGLAFNPEASTVSEAGLPPAAVPPAASLRTWAQRPTRPNLTPARNFLRSRGTVSPAASGTPESDFALPKLPFISRAAPKVSQAAMEPPSEPGFAMPGEVEAANAGDEAKTRSAPAPAVEAPAEPAWNADDEPGLFDDDKAKEPPVEARQTHIDPGEPATETGPRADWPTEMASIDAIFGEDHFIEPDPALDARKEGAEPSPEAIEPASADPAPPFVAEALPAADPREPSPPVVPAASEAALAIVGRYESEGTSYVMYADGSIEARTEHAVLHFKSMVELKTFMESRAQTPHE